MGKLTVQSITLTEACEMLRDDKDIDIAKLMAIQGAICKMEYMAQDLRAKLNAKLQNKSLSEISQACGGDVDPGKEVLIEVPCTGKNISAVLLKYKMRSVTTIAVNENELLSVNQRSQAISDGVVKEETRYKINTPKIKELDKKGILPSYVTVTKNTANKLSCSETVVPLVQPNATVNP